MSGAVFGAPNLLVIDAMTQFVGGTQAVWNDITIPVPSGMVVYAVDTTAVKVGDGTTLYVNLPVVFTIDAIITLAAQMTTLSGEVSTLSGQMSNLENTAAVTTAINSAISAAFAGSPSLGGTPTTNTPPTGDNSNKIPTTAFVATAIANLALTMDAGVTPTQLVGYINAALNNAALTGTPTAPTPTFNSNNTDIATAEFVVQASGNLAGVTTLAASTVLTAANIGKLFVDITTGSASVFTLPALNTIRGGGALAFMTTNFNGCTIQCPGADLVAVGGLAGGQTTSQITLWSGDTLVLAAGGSDWQVVSGTAQLQYTSRVRTRLRANTSFYVNSVSGSDVTGTGTSSAPWATLQYARNWVQANIDLSGHAATFNCSGNFTAGLQAIGMLVGQFGEISEIWDGGGTATVELSTPAGMTFFIRNANLTIQNWGLLESIGGASGTLVSYVFDVGHGGSLYFKNVTIGSALYQISNSAGYIEAIGSYTISGGGNYHWVSGQSATTYVQNVTVTLTGSPHFAVCFADVYNGSNIICDGNTFVGAATGQRYQVNQNSTISTNGAGANYLPGNAAGVVNGGVYV